MEGVQEVQEAARTAFSENGGDLDAAIETALMGKAGLTFLEGNRHFLKDAHPKKFCGDLLANLEWIVGQCGGKVGEPVNVRQVSEGRKLQSRLWELKYWGLVEQVERGVYSITQAAIDFLEGDALIPESVRVWNDKVIEETGKWNYMAAVRYATS